MLPRLFKPGLSKTALSKGELDLSTLALVSVVAGFGKICPGSPVKLAARVDKSTPGAASAA